jgi:hypothetical protein
MSQMPLPDVQLEYTPEELLENGAYSEPLIGNGVRCHGGFLPDGSYRSPRTIHRAPAIEAWQQQHLAGGAPLIEIAPSLMPPQYPNVEQAVLLCRAGVREPVVRALTIIAVVEGFGAIIRDVRVPDLSQQLVEPIGGTALAHLDQGLFEAHARDEAGWGDEGGHKQMWEAARDLAFENPKIPGDVLMRIMGGGGRRAQKRRRSYPQIDEKLERMIATMAQVLVVEIFAESVFQWGLDVLSNEEISAAPGEAARMVSHIRQDESPHVEYLRAALSELSARTIRTVDGKTLPGRDVVRGMLHRILAQTTRNRPKEQRERSQEALAEALKDATSPKALMDEFLSLETTPWAAPAQTGFEPATKPASA